MPIKPKITKLKYPRDMRMVDGDFEHRCGRCGEYFREEVFNRSPFCPDCLEFMKVYNYDE